MTDYHDILHITHSILNYTTVNYTKYYDTPIINQTANQVCFTIYTMFNNTIIIPEYKPFLYFLYASINNTLHCNYTYAPQFNNTLRIEQLKKIFFNNDLLSKKYLRSTNSSSFTYQNILLITLGIIISKVISMYVIGNKNSKIE